MQHKGSSLNGEHCLTELRVICGTAGEWGKLPPVTWRHPTVRTNHTKDQNSCTKMGDYGDYKRLKP
jgi:hypothetical protein